MDDMHETIETEDIAAHEAADDGLEIKARMYGRKDDMLAACPAPRCPAPPCPPSPW